MNEIELNGMAQKLFISANYLSTLFKKETGISFKSYLTNCRLDKSKKLLLDPQYKIYQIANLVGYENEEYLCRLFKSNFGITCKEYRDRNNMNI
jgi:two-component system response regulator YesN